MAIANVTLLNTFDDWRGITNQLVAFTEQSNTILYRVQTTANLGYAAANAASSNASNVGLAANSWANAVGAGGNSYAVSIGAAANDWANAVGAGGNSYAVAVGAGGNAYTVVVGAASNGWANAVGTGGNAYTVVVGAASNGWANAIGTAGNSYAVQVGAAANGWANTQSVTDRLIANNAAIAANNYASATYALKGQTMYVGTTALAINRTSAALNLSGVTLFGNANTATLAGTRGTAVSPAGATSGSFTGIPSGVKTIIIGIYGLSAATGFPQFQLGTSLGYASSGYYGVTVLYGTTGYTNCISLADGASSGFTFYGNIILNNISGNIWTWENNINVYYLGAAWGMSRLAGGVTLSGTLDRIQFYTSTGGTMPAGTVNITYY